MPNGIMALYKFRIINIVIIKTLIRRFFRSPCTIACARQQVFSTFVVGLKC